MEGGMTIRKRVSREEAGYYAPLHCEKGITLAFQRLETEKEVLLAAFIVFPVCLICLSAKAKRCMLVVHILKGWMVNVGWSKFVDIYIELASVLNKGKIFGS